MLKRKIYELENLISQLEDGDEDTSNLKIILNILKNIEMIQSPVEYRGKLSKLWNLEKYSFTFIFKIVHQILPVGLKLKVFSKQFQVFCRTSQPRIRQLSLLLLLWRHSLIKRSWLSLTKLIDSILNVQQLYQLEAHLTSSAI